MKKSLQIGYLITIFLIFFVPGLLFVSGKGKSASDTEENRTLSAMPKLEISTYRVFPTQFEDYFNDHLPLKDQLVFANSYLDYRFFHSSSSDQVVVGKNGWLFYTGTQQGDEAQMKDYLGENLYTEEELQTLASKLNQAAADFQKRGAHLTFVFNPNKSRIYADQMPAAYGKPAENYRLKQVVQYLKANTKLDIVDTTDVLADYHKKNPQNQIYFKYDTHWNSFGSYIATRLLAQGLKRSLPSPDAVSIQDGKHPVYDLARMLHLQDILTEDPAPIVSGYTDRTYESQMSGEGAEIMIHGSCASPEANARKLLLIGDSYGTFMFRFLATEFAQTTYCHYSQYHRDVLEAEKPQEVVFELVERNLSLLNSFSIDRAFPQ